MINNTWLRDPGADLLYACDGKWWRREGEGYGQHALGAFGGMKVSQDAGACAEFGLRRVRLATDDSGGLLDVAQSEPGVIGAGGNSGFQSVNLADQTGADPLLLLGFDMGGEHWHGRHPDGLGNPRAETFVRWRRAFADNAGRFQARVINCTPGSALTCFPQADIEAL